MDLEAFQLEVLPGKNKYFRYSYSITGNRELSEDIVQEVLLKIWDKRTELTDVINKEAWCMRMIRNLSIDKLRVKANQGESLDKVSGFNDPGPTPIEVTLNNEFQESIGQMIGNLPENQKEIVQLRDIQGYSYKEISELLSLDLNTVKVTLFRARKQLREQLKTINIYGYERP